MPKKLGSTNTIYPKTVSSPAEALQLADDMHQNILRGRSIPQLSTDDALLLLRWKPLHNDMLNKVNTKNRIKGYRFGDLLLIGIEGKTRTRSEPLPDGTMVKVPKGHLLANCLCGCSNTLAAQSLLRRVNQPQDAYFNPLRDRYDSQESDFDAQPYICPHVTSLLAEHFPDHYSQWMALRNRLYSTNVIHCETGKPMELESEWFRADLGLYEFIKAVGLPPEGCEGLRTHKLSRFKVRGNYTRSVYYWRPHDEPERDYKGLPLGPTKHGLERIVYSRFHSAMSRARMLKVPFQWESWDEFWKDLQSPDCPKRARIPEDFEPKKYALKWDGGGKLNNSEIGKVGMSLATLHWERTGAAINEDRLKWFEAGAAAVVEAMGRTEEFSLAQIVGNNLEGLQ